MPPAIPSSAPIAGSKCSMRGMGIILSWLTIALKSEVLPEPYTTHELLSWYERERERDDGLGIEHTSRPSSRTLRVLTCTSFMIVAKSLVQNMKKSPKPSGRMNFSILKGNLCSILESSTDGLVTGNSELSESVTDWWFGGRFRGVPTTTRIFWSSGAPWLDEIVGAGGNDSTLVEHLK